MKLHAVANYLRTRRHRPAALYMARAELAELHAECRNTSVDEAMQFIAKDKQEIQVLGVPVRLLTVDDSGRKR